MKILMWFLVFLNTDLIHSITVLPIEFKRLVASQDSYRKRLYGGFPASERDYKFLVYVVIKHGDILGYCGGSLIRADFVLSAAHCFKNWNIIAQNVILVGGKQNMDIYVKIRLKTAFDEDLAYANFGYQEIRAQSVYIHPNFSLKTYYHDIALIQSARNFDKGSVKIMSMGLTKVSELTNCTILGWGYDPDYNSSNYLLVFHGEVYSTASNNCHVRTEGPFYCLQQTDKGLCEGDSGSPLLCNNQIWGLSSHGSSTKKATSCTEAEEAYFTDLTAHKEWIERTLSCTANALLRLNPKIIFSWFVAILLVKVLKALQEVH